jgi:hypothetical protein
MPEAEFLTAFRAQYGDRTMPFGFIESDKRRRQRRAPDSVLVAMKSSLKPLPDTVAAAWANDEDKTDFQNREEVRCAKRSGRGIA